MASGQGPINAGNTEVELYNDKPLSSRINSSSSESPIQRQSFAKPKSPCLAQIASRVPSTIVPNQRVNSRLSTVGTRTLLATSMLNQPFYTFQMLSA